MSESSTILQGAVSTSRANSKVKFIVGGGVIVVLIAYLIISSITTQGAYYREVGEVVAQQTALSGKNLRVSGKIVTESIRYDTATLNLDFKISDPQDSNQQLAIHFHGVQPDQIARQDTEAIVEGTLEPNGTLVANNLLLKCPSRYEEGVLKEYEEVKVDAVK